MIRFIPTETVTLYVGALAVLPALQTLNLPVTNHFIYWGFAILTPIWFAAAYRISRPAQGKLLHWRFVWGILASVIAFCVWGMAIPGNPILDIATSSTTEPTTAQVAGAAVAGFLAVFVSMVLTLIESLLASFLKN